MGLGWGCESEEIQFTTKMEHRYKTRGIKSNNYGELHVDHLGDEVHRKQQVTGQLHRAGIEMKEKQTQQQQYGSIGKDGRVYNWKYQIDGGMEQYTSKALLDKESVEPEDMKFYKNLGDQGRLLIKDIKVNKCHTMAMFGSINCGDTYLHNTLALLLMKTD